MINDRPFVVLNAAVTADGKTDTVARQGAVISSARDLERVDRLRAESDAVMVGGHTLLGDDPQLIVKSAALRAARCARGLAENPIKVGVITNVGDPRTGAALRDDSRFLTAGPAQVILFTTEQSSAAQVERLHRHDAQVFVMGEHQVDLEAALHCLHKLGIRHLLVEGGGTLNAGLLRKKLVDEIYVYTAPLMFCGAGAPTLAGGAGLPRGEAIHLQLRAVENPDDDGVVLHYTVPRS